MSVTHRIYVSLPANLGGDIYAALMDRNDIAPIERTLAAFIGAI